MNRSYLTRRFRINWHTYQRSTCKSVATSTEPAVLLRFMNSESHPYAQFGILSLNRPKARIALSMDLIATLGSHITQLQSHESVRGIILQSSTNGMFCAGADLVERRGMSPAQVSNFLSDMRATFTALSKLPMPTISVIDGHALGGGLELSLCTDFRVVGLEAKVGLVETRLGVPGIICPQRTGRVPPVQGSY